MPQPELGRQLRELRERRGYTRAEIARRCDLSTSFLALVESGKSDISVSRLIKLTEAYDVGLADLLPPRGVAEPEIIRKGEHRELVSEAEKMTMRLLTNTDLDRPLQPIISVLEPGGEVAQYLEHHSDVFLYILSGDLTLTVKDGKRVVVRSGDSVYLEAGTRRHYRNDGDVPVSWLGVVAHPSTASTGDAVQQDANRRATPQQTV